MNTPPRFKRWFQLGGFTPTAWRKGLFVRRPTDRESATTFTTHAADDTLGVADALMGGVPEAPPRGARYRAALSAPPLECRFDSRAEWLGVVDVDGRVSRMDVASGASECSVRAVQTPC